MSLYKVCDGKIVREQVFYTVQNPAG